MYFLCLIADNSAVESAMTVCSEQQTDLPSFCDSADGPAVRTSFEHSTPITPASSMDHDYHEKSSSVEDQLDAARNRILELESQLATMRIERFGLERFSTDVEKIRFYTGFPSYDCLKKFYECIAPHALNMRTWAQVQRSSTGSAFRCFQGKLQPIDQLLLFLQRLRVGSMEVDLADRFGISRSTVSRCVITWANFLYLILGAQPLWPSRQAVDRFMPETFKKLFPKTRVVIDCTEIAVQSPSSLVLRSELYSSYKGRTTRKCLIGVTPAGAVSFISSLYSGSISDKQITNVCGILDLLEPGDLVMSDKGFLIEDMLKEKQCKLVMPNFLRAKGQFTADEAEVNKIIANLRVHVERANRRFKEFHLFDSPLPLTLAGSIYQLWTVACLLTNVQGPLIVNNFVESLSDI
jgi:hypothetical protein